MDMDMLNVYMHDYLLFYQFMSFGIQNKYECYVGQTRNWQNSKLVRFLFLFGLDDKAPVDDEKVCYVLGNWLFWHPVVHNKTFINESRLDSL